MSGRSRSLGRLAIFAILIGFGALASGCAEPTGEYVDIYVDKVSYTTPDPPDGSITIIAEVSTPTPCWGEAKLFPITSEPIDGVYEFSAMARSHQGGGACVQVIDPRTIVKTIPMYDDMIMIRIIGRFASVEVAIEQ